MRELGVVISQVVISLLVVGACLPVVIVWAPEVAHSRFGGWLPFIALAVVFLALRRFWPRRRVH